MSASEGVKNHVGGPQNRSRHLMDAGDPRYKWTAQGLGRAFAAGLAHPRQTVEACLDRVTQVDPKIGACNFLAGRDELLDQAEAAARRWRRRAPLSPLDGVPFGVKANIAVRNWPWHGGIAAFRQRRAATDAACVARLRAGGLIPMALLNMHEAALGETSANPSYRTTLNPHNLAHIAGGSSGGSAAAVAAGLVPIALGTDDLGSVRLPAALCGVVGFKPAHGEIPTEGVIPLSPRLDHLGVHANNLGDVAAVMALLGPMPKSARTETSAAQAVIEWSQWRFDLGQPLAAPVADAVDRLLRQHGVQRTVDWTDVDFSALRRAGLLVCERDAAEYFAAELQERPQGFSSTFRHLVAWGAAQPVEKLKRAEGLLMSMSARLRDDLCGRLLLSPTTPHLAPRRNERPPSTLADLTAPAAIAGVPAISIPTGAAANGLPIGLQITGLDSSEVVAAATTLFPGAAKRALIEEG